MTNYSAPTASHAWFFPCCILAVFQSALLIFLLEPMIAKGLLPQLGGAASVWNTSLAMYQLLLLAGYGYAAGLARLPRTWQLGIHGVLILLACGVVPQTLYMPEQLDAVSQPTRWVVESILQTAGLCFILLAANAPLLQHWLAHTDHPARHTPYRLYAASNLGSFIGLLGYPLIVEASLTMEAQWQWWQIGFWLFATIGIAIIFLCYRLGEVAPASRVQTDRPGWQQRIYWVTLAAIPSGLMVATTHYLATDIASIPLLWAIPLALYLLSFVIVFGMVVPSRIVCWVGSASCFALLICTAFTLTGLGMLLLVLACFFAIVVALHAMLASAKPQPARLTEYYLWMSIGGALGGVFCSFIAPVVFSKIYEYPFLLFMAGLLIAGQSMRWQRRDATWLVVYVIALVALGHADKLAAGLALPVFNLQFALFAGLTFAVLWGVRRRGGLVWAILVVALLFTVQVFIRSDQKQILYQARNFFGVSQVVEFADKQLRVYLHGTTNHGTQRIGADPRVALSYYGMYNALHAALAPQLQHPVAMTGLGSGALTCRFAEAPVFDVFEIDPIVARVAGDPTLFTYISECNPKTRVHLGDGRMLLDKQPLHYYGMIILDAFSSDSVPVHLLTREAMQIYRQHLREDGLIFMNLTNRYFDFVPVMANVAHSLNMAAMVREYPDEPIDEALAPYINHARWVVLANDHAALEPVAAIGDWKRLEPNGKPVWSDDYSNLLGALK